MSLAEFFSDVSVISIILFAIGIILLVIEAFHPGFGIYGGLGIAFLVVDIFVTARTFVQGLIMAAVFSALIVILLTVSVVLASKGRLPKKLILKESTSRETGFSGAEDMKYLVGKTGRTVTKLRPAGNIDLDGVRIDVVSRGEFIEADKEIEVIEVEGNRIVVREKVLCETK